MMHPEMQMSLSSLLLQVAESVVWAVWMSNVEMGRLCEFSVWESYYWWPVASGTGAGGRYCLTGGMIVTEWVWRESERGNKMWTELVSLRVLVWMCLCHECNWQLKRLAQRVVLCFPSLNSSTSLLASASLVLVVHTPVGQQPP